MSAFNNSSESEPPSPSSPSVSSPKLAFGKSLSTTGIKSQGNPEPVPGFGSAWGVPVKPNSHEPVLEFGSAGGVPGSAWGVPVKPKSPEPVPRFGSAFGVPVKPESLEPVPEFGSVFGVPVKPESPKPVPRFGLEFGVPVKPESPKPVPRFGSAFGVPVKPKEPGPNLWKFVPIPSKVSISTEKPVIPFGSLLAKNPKVFYQSPFAENDDDSTEDSDEVPLNTPSQIRYEYGGETKVAGLSLLDDISLAEEVISTWTQKDDLLSYVAGSIDETFCLKQLVKSLHHIVEFSERKGGASGKSGYFH